MAAQHGGVRWRRTLSRPHLNTGDGINGYGKLHLRHGGGFHKDGKKENHGEQWRDPVANKLPLTTNFPSPASNTTTIDGGLTGLDDEQE